jgi:hypothetical protein
MKLELDDNNDNNEPLDTHNIKRFANRKAHIYYFMLPDELSYRISMSPTLGTYKITLGKRLRYSVKDALAEIITAIQNDTIGKENVVVAVDSTFVSNEKKMGIIENLVRVVRLKEIAPRKIYLNAIYGLNSMKIDAGSDKITGQKLMDMMPNFDREQAAKVDINEIATQAISASLRKLNPELMEEVARHKTDDEMLGKYAKADISTLLLPPKDDEGK